MNGSIVLDGIDSDDVEAETVNGRVTYDGTITRRRAVSLREPQRHRHRVDSRARERDDRRGDVQGTFSSRFELPARRPRRDSKRPRGRANFAFGTGSARIEAESFQGNIILTRPGDAVIRQR